MYPWKQLLLKANLTSYLNRICTFLFRSLVAFPTPNMFDIYVRLLAWNATILVSIY